MGFAGLEAQELKKSKVQTQKIIKTKTAKKDKIKEIDNNPENKYDKIIVKYSKKYKVDKYLIKAVIKCESNFNKDAKSSENCLGLMQLSKFRKCPNPYNPDCNINYGTKHLAGLLARYGGNEKLAISAYNIGGAKVKNKIAPSTKKYVDKVLKYKKEYNKGRL